MKLLAIKVECSHELEDGLSFFMQDELDAQGIESRKRSDFVLEGQKHDSSLVELDDIENLPEDLELTAYFDYENADKKKIIQKITDKIAEMKGYGLDAGNVSISTKEVADEDWNTAWQKYYHVIDFSRHLAIVPEWEDYQPAFSDQQLICLDPGLAFGTGGHTTTQLVLLAMERGTAEKMIESFMLMANETVAEDFYKKQVPFLYRVHETPDAERIETFFEFCSAFGLNVHADPNDIKPLDLQKVVSKTTGTPEEAVVQMMMLRSLKQARYSEDALGHFGLAAEYYTHFTSPIRRYSDLMVHRMIHAYQEKGMSEETQKHFESYLPDVAEQTSTQERRSIDTEREVNDLKMTEYMADQVGQHFDAVVASVTSFGMFIQLPNTVEGLIHISNLTDDFYSFNEKSMTLTGRGTHKQYKVGMPIKVTLINANVEQHQLDFEVYDPNAPKKKHNDRGMNNRKRGNRGFHNDHGHRGGGNYNSRGNRRGHEHVTSKNRKGHRSFKH